MGKGLKLASGLIIGLLLLGLTGCSSSQSESKTMKFGLPPWPGVTVKTEVMQEILEERNYTVEYNKLDSGIVYSQMAEGNLDALLAGWLPTAAGEYWDEHGDKLEKVAVNVNETWQGLAVPAYTYERGINSIKDLNQNSELFNNEIVGIEPGAGTTQSAMEAVDFYNLTLELRATSTPAMMGQVDSAIQEGRHVVFTIWEPHSAFAQFDIRKLEDPQKIFGEGDKVYTIVREGFKEDHPRIYEFFKKFRIKPETQSRWINEYSNKDRDPETIAKEWVKNNSEKVEKWWPDS